MSYGLGNAELVCAGAATWSPSFGLRPACIQQPSPSGKDLALTSDPDDRKVEPMMRAIRQSTLGGPEVLELVELPRPQAGPTEVLVRATAAGVNPVDWKVRARGGFLEPPFTVGWDVAGVVETLGRGVTRFEPGDRVFGMPRFPREAAAYAEYVTSPSRQLARIPDSISDVEAAALPLAGLTAWQALVETADVQRGQRVLILAAAGGVGHLAVQIAKARGAYVVGTASLGKHAFLTELGADETIDYTSEDVAERVRDVDVVLDLVGGDDAGRTLSALRDGGIFIRVPSASDIGQLLELAAGRVRVTGILVEPDRAGLEALADLADAGELRAHVSHTFPLEEAARAHALGETGRTQGKLVLTVG
jgi:NADPH:quinone reductase-like Zn-dependent oxidoreductase